jgi:hypothetical protein
MKRLDLLKLALVIGLGFSAGASLRATDADAAPLTPAPLAVQHDVRRAVTSSDEAVKLAPQQVRWGHHWHRHWHHRHWHHRHWHHRHWGWRHRHHHWGWHHHHWHHRHW